MAKDPQSEFDFNSLLRKINQETNAHKRKLDILFDSKGFFSAEQAAQVLHAIPAPADKVSAIKIMESRMCRMTCDEARGIIGAISIHNDKLIALDCLKRSLVDCQFRMGKEFILNAFTYETDKMRALRILNTVQSEVADKMAAGGHQGYAAVGGLFTQSRPLVPNLYGTLDDQIKRLPGRGDIKVPLTAKPGVVPSIYTGHPSYAYPKDKTYAETRGYPGAHGYLPTGTAAQQQTYPAGAPPLSFLATGAPAPTGFPGLSSGMFDGGAWNHPAANRAKALAGDSY